MTEETIDLRDMFDRLIRRWKFVVAMPVLAAIAAALVSFAMKPTYEATAVIALSPATLSIPTTSQAPPYYLMVDSPQHLPLAYSPTYYLALLSGNDVVAQTAPQAAVSFASNSSDRSLIEVTARGDDANKVQTTANAYAQAGAARIQQVFLPSGKDVAAAQQKLDAADQALIQFSKDNGFGEYDLNQLRAATFSSTDKQLELSRLLRDRDVAEPVYLDLARGLERAQILVSSAYSPTVILAPVPGAPVSPKLTQNILVGAVFGLLLGVLGAFGLEFLSRRGREN
jgi:capsular polysaccharide biosynthesis protein